MTVERFVINFPDIPRIVTAFAEWSACLICLLTVARKKDRVRFAAVSALFLIVQSVFLVLTDEAEGLTWNICMAAAVLLMYFYIRSSADTGRNLCICCCCIAFAVSEFTASFGWQIWCYIHDLFGTDGAVKMTITLSVVFAAVLLGAWKIGRHIFDIEGDADISFWDTAQVIVAAVLTFAVSNLGFLPVRVPFAGRDSLETFNMRTMVDLGGLAVIYAFMSQRKSAYMKHELESIQTILNSQYEQYKQAERTVDLINYRYHDLKNHIIALRTEDGGAGREAYLDRLEEEIYKYEALNKTGNQVLDTLLTSKNLRCIQHRIAMTCMVDGALFDFMDVMDICSIFGNALDNAIECELKIREYEKRMIHVDARSEKNFLIIRVENYYEGAITFNKGVPVTTKAEKNLHGYGLKSLKYTVQKYKGGVHIEAKDNWFSLRILIPLQIA